MSTVNRLFTSLFSNTLFVYYGFGPWTFIDYIKFEREIVNFLLNISYVCELAIKMESVSKRQNQTFSMYKDTITGPSRMTFIYNEKQRLRWLRGMTQSRIFHSYGDITILLKGCIFWPKLGTYGHWAERVF